MPEEQEDKSRILNLPCDDEYKENSERSFITVLSGIIFLLPYRTQSVELRERERINGHIQESNEYMEERKVFLIIFMGFLSSVRVGGAWKLEMIVHVYGFMMPIFISFS